MYNDIDPNTNPDILGDMLSVTLCDYDFIIATPPCNYYSIINYRRETSFYSQQTKHLLPSIIDKLIENGKPFIVENVRNKPLFTKAGLMDKNCYIYFIGRHTYWTNIQLLDFELDYLNNIQTVEHIKYIPYKNHKREGHINVYEVIRYFIWKIIYYMEEKK